MRQAHNCGDGERLHGRVRASLSHPSRMAPLRMASTRMANQTTVVRQIISSSPPPEERFATEMPSRRAEYTRDYPDTRSRS